MDAFELTRPILSHRGPTTEAQRSSVDARDALTSARRYVNQLPLGAWAGPPFDGPRWSPQAASRGIERSLFRAAAAHGVAVGVDDSAAEIARRLVRCRVIVTPAGDGAVALLGVLRGADDTDGTGDATKLADRLVGYLDHRASTSIRRSVSVTATRTRSVSVSESEAQTLRASRTVTETLRWIRGWASRRPGGTRRS